MPLEFGATEPACTEETCSLLCEAFGLPAAGPNLQPSVLRWKYHDSGPEWNGSRSYALRSGDRMVAHAGVWPIRLATPSGPVSAIQMVDWGAAKKVAGAGTALALKLRALAPVMITAGGSEDTRQILPLIGFVEQSSTDIYARVLRPWKQFRTRPPGGLKGVAKLARNTLWSISGRTPGGWRAEASQHPDPELLSRLEAQPVALPGSRHSSQFLKFLMRCPAVRIQYYNLVREGRPQGYCVLSQAGGQCRLADLRILGEQPEEWAAAYSAAVSAASEDAQACEIIACASVPLAQAALAANGFRRLGSIPVFVRDPGTLLAGAPRIHLGMLDDDSSFLIFPQHPYAT